MDNLACLKLLFPRFQLSSDARSSFLLDIAHIFGANKCFQYLSDQLVPFKYLSNQDIKVLELPKVKQLFCPWLT